MDPHLVSWRRRAPRCLLAAAALAAALRPAWAQPLAGGGGGGGGGFGGSSSSGHHDSSPTCAPNCWSCSSDDTCDRCNSGYVLNPVGTRCLACGGGCRTCDVAGPGLCDECHRRYVLVNRECRPCAHNCLKCDVAGPRRCEVCDDGYMIMQDGGRDRSWSMWGNAQPNVAVRLGTCVACATGCRSCHDTTRTGCDTCFYSYALKADGSCGFRWLELLAFLLAVVCIAWYWKKATAARVPPSHASYISRVVSRDGSSEAISVARAARGGGELPSGTWRGYYTYSGTRHDVCEFSLNFSEGGVVRGDGVDDVARYTIQGLEGNGNIAFSKTYVQRSLNIHGAVHYGNKGHTVEYRGRLAGATLGSGFRGTWSIRSSLGDYDGEFHLWPGMEGWADDEAAAAGGAVGAPGGEGPTFEEHECVVCYDRPISTCLWPCGHVALCGVCAGRLQHQRCPLCRARISTVEHRRRRDEPGGPGAPGGGGG